MILQFIRVTNATVGGFVIGYFVTQQMIGLIDNPKISEPVKALCGSVIGLPIAAYGFHLAVQKN